MERETLTILEVSKILGISPRHAYLLAARGDLPGALRLGSRWVIVRARLEEMLAKAGSPTGPYQVPVMKVEA